MPPLHPGQGQEVFIKTGDMTKASLMETPSTPEPDLKSQSDSQSDFLYEEDEYFEFTPRAVDTVISTTYGGDVDSALNLGPGTVKVEYPNTLHGLLAWTVTIEGSRVLNDAELQVIGLPEGDMGPSLIMPRNHQTPSSRYLQGAYSALANRVGNWPKTNEEAQMSVDAWSANRLASSGWDLPGLVVANTVHLNIFEEQAVVDELRNAGIDDVVRFTDGFHRKVMSYVPKSELATVVPLYVDRNIYPSLEKVVAIAGA